MGDPERRVTAREYARKVEEWKNNYYHMAVLAHLWPYYEYERSMKAAGLWPPPQIPAASAVPEAGAAGSAQEADVRPRVVRGIEFGIPPLWKRLCAEFLDFLILLVIKFFITYIAIDQFGLIDLDNLAEFAEVSYPEPALMKASLKVALEVTSDVMILETVHRFAVCIYEGICTRGGRYGVVGGATPGKMALGLKVVSCEWVAQTGEHRALVYPAKDLGFWRAFARAIMKSFSLAFFLPITFSLFYMQHNRTAYDHLAGSIVVQNADDPQDVIPYMARFLPQQIRRLPWVRRML